MNGWRVRFCSGVTLLSMAVSIRLMLRFTAISNSTENCLLLRRSISSQGGDSDYDNFVAGNYRHIIFNLGLQEGWDDPECCFAYIDKDMGSPDQVTQIIGRVLRQPGAEHYPAMILNTAHFYNSHR